MNFNPIDFLRDRMDRIRAHPIQAGLGALAGIAGGPLAGQLANRGFNWLNNRQFAGATDQANQTLGNDISDTSHNIWDRPLDGPLGQFGDSGAGNGPLAQAIGGYSGPTQQPFQNNYGNNYGQGVPGGNGTGWTQQGNPGGLLDFLGAAQGGGFDDGIPRGPNGVPLTPQGRRDAGYTGGGIGNFHAGGPMGVTNMVVGGMPVIQGSYNTGDPNQAYYRGPGGL